MLQFVCFLTLLSEDVGPQQSGGASVNLFQQQQNNWSDITYCAVDDDDEEGRINFSVALSPKDYKDT